MGGIRFLERRATSLPASALIGALLVACGGGTTGNEQDSGLQQTTLSVNASDVDGDALTYEWRVTGGTVDNRNGSHTVWTLPAGRGLHFAYVVVSDGRGGYAERQYAVSTDQFDIDATRPGAVAYTAAPSPSVVADEGKILRLRLSAPGNLVFNDATGASGERTVYLPDMPVSVRLSGSATALFTGTTDLAGELNLPKLPAGTYDFHCATTPGAALRPCGSFSVAATGPTRVQTPPLAVAGSNIRVYGHVSLGDDGVCGTRNEYFGLQEAASVQLLRLDGQAVTEPRRVNQFGDYFIDAAVANSTPLTLRIRCGSATHEASVSPGAGGFQAASPIELSHRFSNQRPTISRMVAVGPDGSVRGREVLPEQGAASNALPGGYRFLSYKGTDSAVTACRYYRALGAVSDCGPRGELVQPISFDDWRRHHHFGDDSIGEPEVSATYINERDLNLVRSMVAKRVGPEQIAFYVCNSPGPEIRSQAAVNEAVRIGSANERRVACVAMEWSTTAGVNLDTVTSEPRPFTKFFTFGPTGELIRSVNLDTRGEKFMPGACVACHGGLTSGGRFPETGNPSPLLGSRFLPFDTGNYLFSTHGGLTEEDQGAAFYRLNRLVAATEGAGAETATTRLVDGWYARSQTRLDKQYVPGNPDAQPPVGWHASADKAMFYRQVIGTSCRTCHAALGSADESFNWDSNESADQFNGLTSGKFYKHVCGGTPDLALNGSMPNALASLDRLLDANAPDISGLRNRMQLFLGCTAPWPDPVFPRR